MPPSHSSLPPGQAQAEHLKLQRLHRELLPSFKVSGTDQQTAGTRVRQSMSCPDNTLA